MKQTRPQCFWLNIKKRFNFKSIQTKMILAILSLVVFPMLAVTFISFRSSEQFIQERIRRTDSQVLSQFSSTINSVLEDMIQASNMFTLDEQVIDILSAGGNLDKAQRYNNARLLDQQLVRAQNTFLLKFNSYICLYDFYGNIYSSSARRSEDSFEKFKDTAWFKRTIEMNGYMIWLAPQYDYIQSEATGNGPLITLSRLIKGKRSQGGYGIITISISEEEFNKNLFNRDYYGEGDELFIIDKNGIIVSSSDPSQLNKMIKNEPYYANIQNGESKDFIDKINGSPKFISFEPVQFAGWTVVKVSDYATLFKDLIQIRNQNILYIIIISVVLIFVCAFIIISITRPLKRLGKSMELVEGGNMRVSVDVKGSDEVAQLGNSFNSMLLRINNLIESIREKQKKEEELRLEVMQAQINPHFLFNTLNTIKWTAIISQANNVAGMIEALGRILEMSIKDIHLLVSLKDELENLKSYLCLQRARYNQRFTEKILVDKQVEGFKVPKLILQPIVENSIIHGMSDGHSENLNIEIIARIENDNLVIAVHDDGVGIDPEKLSDILDDNGKDVHRNRFSRIGLQNVHKRIQLMFGNPYGLKIMSVPGVSTDVEIWVPLLTGEEQHDKNTYSR